jgi:hypothetical protein
MIVRNRGPKVLEIDKRDLRPRGVAEVVPRRLSPGAPGRPRESRGADGKADCDEAKDECARR